MGQILVVAELHGYLTGKPRGEVAVAAFVFRRAAAELHELDVGVQHFLQRAELDVHAFLFRQPRNGAEERNFFINGQGDLALQFQLVDSFSPPCA